MVEDNVLELDIGRGIILKLITEMSMAVDCG